MEKATDSTSLVWPTKRRVVLPVVSESGPTAGTVVGFVYFVITDVQGPPAKSMEGYWDLDTAYVPGSVTGGECFGVRASASVLID